MPFQRHRSKKKYLRLILPLAAALSLPIPLNAVDITGPATTAPSSPVASPSAMQRAFADLSDPHPAARESARMRLMGMTRADLPAFANLAKSNLPLSPAEIESLHDIVTQVYLFDSAHESDPTAGFLGVAFDGEQNFIEPECGGVEIRYRIPGFCSYRFFQDGDVVLSIFNSTGEYEFHGSDEMQEEIRRHPAGDRVMFRILRRGQVIKVAVVLGPRPLDASGSGSVIDFIARRRAEAEAYWDEMFEPMIEPPANPSQAK
jgi:hypothetical protein